MPYSTFSKYPTTHPTRYYADVVCPESGFVSRMIWHYHQKRNVWAQSRHKDKKGQLIPPRDGFEFTTEAAALKEAQKEAADLTNQSKDGYIFTPKVTTFINL